ncbi:MAG: PIN domain-containing protein [Acidobacteriota bacterium]|nr:PIN domain-containing protein [Acidobacteriota bacterium]
MILVDANLLIYAHVSDLPEHSAARSWLEDQLTRGPRAGLAWPSILAFLRLVTNPRVFERAETVARAWDQVREWLSLETVWIPRPTDRHAAVLETLLPLTKGSANLIADAHLAALAIEHGVTLCSADSDFARFPGLKWTNPLS